MNENANRMEPQAPDTETEIADEMLEGASGGSVYYRNGRCLECGTPVEKYGWFEAKYYCPKCKQTAIRELA